MNPMDPHSKTHRLSFNGEPVHTDSATLQALLEERGCDLRAALACAVNRRFVPRPQWPHCALRAGDQVDVVAPVTGG